MSAIAGTGSTLVVEVVPTVATTAIGTMPAARSSAMARCERVGPHAEIGVRRHAAKAVVAEAEQDHRLVDRRVRLVGAVDAVARQLGPARHPRCPHAGDRRLARRRQRVQARDRRRVVDDAFEGVGQAHQLTQPPERHLLEFGHRRRGPPQHALRVERGGQQLRQHARPAARDGEVGEEAGVVPVGDARERSASRSRPGSTRTPRPARAARAGSERRMSPGLTCESTG